jgi:hypothetical protein
MNNPRESGRLRQFAALVAQKLNEEWLLCTSYGQVPSYDSPEECISRVGLIIEDYSDLLVNHDTYTGEQLRDCLPDLETLER